MGIDLNGGFVKILEGKRSYKDFNQCNFLMLGKLKVVGGGYKYIRQILDARHFECRDNVIGVGGYREVDSYELLKWLGFHEVHALDCSDYEGADTIFNLVNIDVPDSLRNQFDYIYDGGTLQQIFNVPQALVNLCKMVKVNGHIIMDIPSANYVDHGFYCFQPMVLIKFFESNGFLINSINLMGIEKKNNKLYHIFSPDCRYNNCDLWYTNCASGYRIQLVCDAIKMEEKQTYNISFSTQTYEELWEGKQNKQPLGRRILKKSLNLAYNILKDASDS